MISKQEIIDQARSLGFADVGFTSSAPFDSQKELLVAKREEYAWAEKLGLDLLKGTDPEQILPGAKSIIVLIDGFFRESFPPFMEAHFGRAYLDDDRKTRDRGATRVKAFRQFLRDNGIDSKVPFDMPHRLSAARAGLGTFGKNCLFFANKGALGGSWATPIACVVDVEFVPDEPTVEFGCPAWCKNACIAACPTKALQGGGKIDPRKCISHLSYRGDGIPPVKLRESMGLWIYGCDRCQNVCPRNLPWLAKQRDVNEKVAAMEEDFQLTALLHMDEEYFKTRIWPHMFYMPVDEIWRWKMNVARAMGNSRDLAYIPHLIRAFRENTDERVCGMIAWALGRLGGADARAALEEFLDGSSGAVREEIRQALSN